MGRSMGRCHSVAAALLLLALPFASCSVMDTGWRRLTSLVTGRKLTEEASIWQKYTKTENAFYRGPYLAGDTATASAEACAEMCSDPASAGLFMVCHYWSWCPINSKSEDGCQVINLNTTESASFTRLPKGTCLLSYQSYDLPESGLFYWGGPSVEWTGGCPVGWTCPTPATTEVLGPCQIANGTVVRCTKTENIFIIEDGTRRWYPNVPVYVSYGPPAVGFEEGGDCPLIAACPMGKDITPRLIVTNEESVTVTLPETPPGEPVAKAVVQCPSASQRITSTSTSWACMSAPNVTIPNGPYGTGWACPDPPPPECNACAPNPTFPANASDVVASTCLGLNSCEVNVSAVTLGDPCLWCTKVLQVTARCTGDVGSSSGGSKFVPVFEIKIDEPANCYDPTTQSYKPSPETFKPNNPPASVTSQTVEELARLYCTDQQQGAGAFGRAVLDGGAVADEAVAALVYLWNELDCMDEVAAKQFAYDAAVGLDPTGQLNTQAALDNVTYFITNLASAGNNAGLGACSTLYVPAADNQMAGTALSEVHTGSNGPMLAFSNYQAARNNTFIRAAYLGAKTFIDSLEVCSGICTSTPNCQYYAWCPPGGPNAAGCTALNLDNTGQKDASFSSIAPPKTCILSYHDWPDASIFSWEGQFVDWVSGCSSGTGSARCYITAMPS